MRASAGPERITTVERLVEVIGEPLPRVRDKARTVLHDLDRAWLAASPFCLVATAATDGSCDVSPKGDPAGRLVHVMDERTLAIPERTGNRRADGYRNILANPHVGLVFLIPGRGDTLRINGRAHLVADAPWFDDVAVRGSRPVLAVVVEVDEVFHHCAKAFRRSRLWDPSSWAPTDLVPPRPQLAKTLDRPEASLDELEAYYGESYAERLY